MCNGYADDYRRGSVPDVVNISPARTPSQIRHQHLKKSEKFVSQSTLLKDPHLAVSSLSLRSNHSGIMMRKDIFYTGSIKSINNLSK